MTMNAENLAEAKRLRSLWSRSRRKLSQAEFGDRFNIGNQSAVGQFLRGDVPLSLNAAIGFAEGLRCGIDEFSLRLSRLAAIAGVYATAQGRSPLMQYDLTALSRDELNHVLLLRQLSPADRASLKAFTENLTPHLL